MKLPTGIALRASALLLGTSAALSASAQVTYYNNNASSPYYRNFSAGPDGSIYFGDFNQTKVFTGGGTSLIDFGVWSISSDGTRVGGYRKSDGTYAAGFLDAFGSLNSVDFGPNSAALLSKEGDYSIFGTTNSSGRLYSGTTDLGSFSDIKGLNASGQLVYGNNLRLGDGSVRDLSIASSSSTLGGGAQDLNNLGKVLLTTTDRAPGGIGYPYAENFTFNFQTFDAATGDLLNLPAMPFVYSDSLVFDSMRKSVVASINDAGDVVAAIRTNDTGEVDSSVIWHYSQNTGWSNLTSLYAIPTFDYLTGIDITNEGLIYGTYTGPYNPWNFTTVTKGFTMNAPVPEPGTMLLLAAGAGGLIAARKRKNKV